MSEATEELKPCPFCGATEIGFAVSRGSRGYADQYDACCNECGASTDMFHDKEEAAEKWNTRHERDGLLGQAGEAHNQPEIPDRVWICRVFEGRQWHSRRGLLPGSLHNDDPEFIRASVAQEEREALKTAMLEVVREKLRESSYDESCYLKPLIAALEKVELAKQQNCLECPHPWVEHLALSCTHEGCDCEGFAERLFTQANGEGDG